MTGYGIAVTDFANAKYTVEIKSLNSKFLELALKLPKSFADKEFVLRNECSKQIERGKVNVAVTVEYSEVQKKTASIDSELLKSYYNQLREAADQLNDSGSNLLQMALNFPDVVKYEEDTISDEEWIQMHKTFNAAMLDFQKFRSDEGGVLQLDLVARVNSIYQSLQRIEEEAPKRIPQIKDRLTTLLEENVGKENYDQNRLEQELIFYIDKLDVTEEKIRLKSHCDYFLETLKSPDANGKKLGFISQEIGREINTIGSKANDAHIQQIVVGMKEELEKVKEQLLNVL
ncbi:MAG: YicC family protein [Sphingobacteriaceae bacterium]|nr:YicC family protein [Sphingobacteriaceae bacterium]